MISFTISFLVFALGLSLWIANKMMKCASWYLGYFLVIVQGIGIGFMIEYGLDYFGVI